MVQLASAVETLMDVGTRLVDGNEHATFELRAGPLGANELTVLSFTGSEAISELFAFDVVCWCGPELTPLASLVLGKPATFTMMVQEGQPRVVQGIVAAVEFQGTVRGRLQRDQYRIRVVPRMWLLEQRKNSRIFQDRTPPQIVSEVLNGAGIKYRWSLTREYPVRTYCVQYRETDYDFVKRVLAEEGIFFHFEPPLLDADALMSTAGAAVSSLAGAAAPRIVTGAASVVSAISEAVSAELMETVVFSDSAERYPAIPEHDVSLADTLVTAAVDTFAPAVGGLVSTIRELAGVPLSPRIPYRSGDGMRAAEESVDTFTLEDAVRSTSNHLRDYDFRHPMLRLDAGAVAKAPSIVDALVDTVRAPASFRPSELGALIGQTVADLVVDGTPLEVYEHHGQYQEPEVQRAVANRHLEQLRTERRVARGHGYSRRFFAGARFTLDGAGPHDREYVISRVRHEGLIPEYQADQHAPRHPYQNHFECVPSDVAYRPAPAQANLQQVLESATVVGPPGEEIYTDSFGRIKVQFHWDRRNVRQEHSSCWIRVSQTWAGAGWGFQFIPRVGMEVLVSFIGGDEDRPIVIGCVYNGTHPVPHVLPDRRTCSAIRSQSTPRSDGFNELAFEDAAGVEELRLRAQRDMRELVLNDRFAEVRSNDDSLIGETARRTFTRTA